MPNLLEKKLEECIGKYIHIRYILPNDEREGITGFLKEITMDYIKIVGIGTHYINKKTATILEIEIRYKDG